jgi:VanZ like protein
MAAIFAFTLVPIAADNDVELVPLGDLVEAVSRSDSGRLAGYVLESIANVLLFMPFGAALAWRGIPLSKAIGYGLALSVGIELAQLLIVSGRTTSVDDVLLNTLGAALGHMLLSRSKPARSDRSGASLRDLPAERASKSPQDVEIAPAREKKRQPVEPGMPTVDGQGRGSAGEEGDTRGSRGA